MKPYVNLQRGKLAERGSHHALNVDKANWISRVPKEDFRDESDLLSFYPCSRSHVVSLTLYSVALHCSDEANVPTKFPYIFHSKLRFK